MGDTLRGGTEGEQLGSYRLVRKLGRGGMGEVWLAEHVTIKSQVAIKLVLAPPDDADAASRFLREAKATAKIRHPGVVTVSDFGPREAGGAYLVMELLEGESLADRIERGALPADLAIDIGVQTAEALAAAHATGVIHRDLKPANIFLVRDAAARNGVRVKLVDFGVAKATGRVTDELGMTVTGALVGTPIYMAPEQCTSRKGPIDHRVDLYALGIVLYEMLTGKPPFRGPTLGDLIDQHLNETPTPPRTFEPAIPAKLDVLIVNLLAKERTDRPASANDVASALHAMRGTTPMADLVDALASQATPRVGDIDATVDSAAVPGALTKATQTAPPAAAVTAVEPRKVPRALIWGLAGGFVLFTAILVVIVLNRRELTPEAPPTPEDGCAKGLPGSCLVLVDKERRESKPDLIRIAGWMRTACENGSQLGCARLAEMYMWGAGVRADIERARMLAATACLTGTTGHGCDLAGDLQPADGRATTIGFYQRGCELGHAASCGSFARRVRFGFEGQPADPARSKELHVKATQLAASDCKAGDAMACRMLGIAYIRGDGVEKDPMRGALELQRACDLGEGVACGELGEMYAIGAGTVNKDPARAKALLEMACTRGAASSCMTLAVAQAYGLLGEPADVAKGFATARHACEERSPLVCSVVGNFYLTGTGAPKDVALATSAYERGCRAGDADSCAQLAATPSFASDAAKREDALKRACALGAAIGCKKLGDAAREKKDFASALASYEQACVTSDRQFGCAEVARAYFNGEGVPADPARGKTILEDDCRENAMATCHTLAVRLRDGKGLPANPAEALRTFERACSLGWGKSCLDAAAILETGTHGMTADPARAKTLRARGCTVDPELCVDQSSESRSESPPQ